MAFSLGTSILLGGVAAGGLSLLGSNEASKAAKSAAKTQAQATDQATALQREMYYQSREDMAPWMQAGQRALGSLEQETGTLKNLIQDPGSYQRSPGYNFLLQEGIGAINRGAAATGKLDSGQRSKDLMRFGQGLALQDYLGAIDRQNLFLNRLAGTAGAGQSTAGSLGTLGGNYAGNVGNLFMQKGEALAEGQIGQANARTGLYQNLGNLATGGMENYFFLKALGKA